MSLQNEYKSWLTDRDMSERRPYTNWLEVRLVFWRRAFWLTWLSFAVMAAAA